MADPKWVTEYLANLDNSKPTKKVPENLQKKMNGSIPERKSNAKVR